MGRAIWQTNPYNPASSDPSASTPVATYTVYNQLGQAVETDSYTGTSIVISTSGSGVSSSALASAGTEVSTAKTYYDLSSRVIETISPGGLRTGTIYYPDGSVEYTGPLATAAPNGGDVVSGSPTYQYTLSDLSSRTTTSYDNYDVTQGMFYTSVTSPISGVTKTYVDSEGRTVRVVAPNGGITKTIYSIGMTPQTSQGITQGTEQAITGYERTVVDAMGNPTDYFYDPSGNLTDVYAPYVNDALNSGAATRPHTQYVYDSSGDEIEQIDAKGNITTFGYDQYGNMDYQALPPTGVSGINNVQSWTYDAFGDVLTHTDYDGNVATYTYNGTGAFVTIAGSAISQSPGSLSQVYYGAASGSGKTAQTVSYAYDALGRPKIVADASGTTTYTYDAFGNQTVIQSPEGMITYTFDPATGNHTETNTGSTDTKYGYNSLGQLVTVTVSETFGVTLSTVQVTTYTYDAAGDKTSELLPDGIKDAYTYNSSGQLTGIDDYLLSTGAIRLLDSYTYNLDGMRTKQVEQQLMLDGTTDSATTTWTYDNDNRLTGEQLSTSLSSGSYTDVYTYDLDGNQITKTHTGPGGGGANETITFTYDVDNQMTLQVSSLHGTTTYTYDSNGSQLTINTGSAATTYGYAYDVRNRMASYTMWYSGNTYTYYDIYDDAGNMVKETIGSTPTTYLIDTDNPTGYSQPAETYINGTLNVSYIMGSRVIGTATASGGSNVDYYLVDEHDSVRTQLTSTGSAASVFIYNAYGLAIDGTSQPIYGFAGDAFYDFHSGLFLNGDGIRTRRPGSPDFDQRDTDGEGEDSSPITLNAEIYGDGDPVNNNDPSGHYVPYTLTGELVTDVAGDGWDAEVEGQMAQLGAGALGQATQVVLAEEGQSVAAGLLNNAISMSASNTLINALTGLATSAAAPFLAVIGSFPAYWNMAQGTLANYFSVIPGAASLEEIEGPLQYEFLRNAVNAGQTFVIAQMGNGKGLALEIAYLIQNGYEYSADGALLVPGGQ